MDFKVEVMRFEAQLNLDDFIEWMNTFEKAFECKDISNDKKVKLITWKLCRYASI